MDFEDPGQVAARLLEFVAEGATLVEPKLGTVRSGNKSSLYCGPSSRIIPDDADFVLAVATNQCYCAKCRPKSVWSVVHNVIMIGPPRAGKTLLAPAMPRILPEMSIDEALDVTRIYSVADALPPELMVRTRPFRVPHHTISHAGLVGGGNWPHPGEISLARRGVLFLDELPEFGPRVLEVMRQPIEDKVVTISRAQGSLTFPANFMLVAAMNPCPCG